MTIKKSFIRIPNCEYMFSSNVATFAKRKIYEILNVNVLYHVTMYFPMLILILYIVIIGKKSHRFFEAYWATKFYSSILSLIFFSK